MAVSNGSGGLCFPPQAGSITRFTGKSGSLNLPIEIRTEQSKLKKALFWATHPGIYIKYWKGKWPRWGNNPIVFLNIENGTENAMGLPNSGPVATLDEMLLFPELNYDYSVTGQTIRQLKRVVKIVEKHEASKQILSYEINVSCPNTHAGETCSFDDLNKIADYVKTAKKITNKPVGIKFGPLVDLSKELLTTLHNVGVDYITLTNTMPGEGRNGYTNEVMLIGGIGGPIINQRMLKMISDGWTNQQELGINIPMVAVGGITKPKDLITAIKAGAERVQIVSGFKGKNEKELSDYIKSFEEEAAKYDLDAIRGTEPITEDPAYMNNPNAWSNGRLIVKSYDHKQYIIDRIVKESVDSYSIYFKEDFPEHEIAQYVAIALNINGRFEERPFTIAGKNRVIIHNLREHSKLHKQKLHKKKAYGKVSNTLTKLASGEKVYIRKPTGNGLKFDKLGKTLAIGGGCGAAAIAELREKTDCDYILAFANKDEVMLEQELSCTTHIDAEAGGVLNVSSIKFNEYEDIVLCGPTPMMFAAAEKAREQGVNTKNIHLVMESIFKCFNGVCGACDCGGIRLCTTGPVITYQQLLDLKYFAIRDKSGKITYMRKFK